MRSPQTSKIRSDYLANKIFSCLNVFAVEWYGEAEFWLATGKIALLAIVFCFTFITMVGGNPKHDAYGFRYWNNPGAFAEHITTGALGRFEGFLGIYPPGNNPIRRFN